MSVRQWALAMARKKMLGHGVDPAFAAPLDRHVVVVDPLQIASMRLGCKQKMVVDEVDRAVTLCLQMLELVDHMLGRCASAICLR